MSAAEKLMQAIFDREIKRLHELSRKAPLDMADLVKLEKLVSAYSKYKPRDDDDDLSAEMSELTTEELIEAAK